MIFGLRDGALLPLVPLVVAGLALAVRQATRQVEVLPESHAQVTPFVVPSALLAALRPTGTEESYTIDEQHSRALWGLRGADERVPLRVTGSLALLPDDALAGLELDLSAPVRATASVPSFTASQIVHAIGRHSHVPNTHTCSVACQVSLLGETRDLRFEVAWMRLPGGTLHLQAVAELDGLPATIVAPARLPWGRAPGASVSLDLVLQRKN